MDQQISDTLEHLPSSSLSSSSVAINSSSSSSSSSTIMGSVFFLRRPITCTISSRFRGAGLTLACILGYGASLYANGIATKELRMNIYDTLVILGTVRGLSLLFISGILIFSSHSANLYHSVHSLVLRYLLRWEKLGDKVGTTSSPLSSSLPNSDNTTSTFRNDEVIPTVIVNLPTITVEEEIRHPIINPPENTATPTVQSSSTLSSLSTLSEPSPTIRSYLPYIVPGIVAFIANSGYAPYNKLMESDQEISSLSGMVSLYIIIPVLFGFYCGEERSPTKIIGILLSIIAVTLLGYDSTMNSSSSSSTSSSYADPSSSSVGKTLEYIGLYISILLCWGGGDALSGYLGRELNTLQIALSASCGQFFTAALYGFIRICQVSSSVTVVEESLPLSMIMKPMNYTRISSNTDDGGVHGGYGSFVTIGTNVSIGSSSLSVTKEEDKYDTSFLAGNTTALLTLIVANMAGVCGWLCFVIVGRIGEVSTFAPLVSLYVYIPVILGIFLLHDTVSVMKGSGLILSIIGGITLSWGWKRRRTEKMNEGEEEEKEEKDSSRVGDQETHVRHL